MVRLAVHRGVVRSEHCPRGTVAGDSNSWLATERVRMLWKNRRLVLSFVEVEVVAVRVGRSPGGLCRAYSRALV